VPTATIQSGLVKLAVGMFQASPNAVTYAELAGALAAGMAPVDLARALAASTEFRALYAESLDAAHFAAAFLRETLGLAASYDFSAPGANADYRWAYDALAARVGEVGRGQTVYEALVALASADISGAFGAARQRLENRAEVAEHYIANDGAAQSLPELRAVVAAVGADSRSVDPAIAAIDAQAGDAWTIMVYMAADNDLEAYSFLDINELEAARLPAGVNVVVGVDRVPGQDSSHGNWTDTRVGSIVGDGDTARVSTALTSVGEINMGDAASLTAFMDWAAQTQPAAHYALVLWGHGGGVYGVSFDQTSGNDALTPGELGTAIAASRIDALDMVGFDACVMAQVEVAQALDGLVPFVAASEDVEPGEGWNYSTWLNAAFAQGANIKGAALATAAVGSYAAEYVGESDITMSALDLAALPGLLAALDGFVAAASHATTQDWQAIGRAHDRADYFYDADAVDVIDFVDALLAQGGVSSDLSAAARGMSAAAATAVVEASSSEAGAHGLSIYWPDARPAGFAGFYNDVEIPLLAGVAWDGFLDSYWYMT